MTIFTENVVQSPFISGSGNRCPHCKCCSEFNDATILSDLTEKKVNPQNYNADKFVVSLCPTFLMNSTVQSLKDNPLNSSEVCEDPISHCQNFIKAGSHLEIQITDFPESRKLISNLQNKRMNDKMI
jgi:hypothetical protein